MEWQKLKTEATGAGLRGRDARGVEWTGTCDRGLVVVAEARLTRPVIDRPKRHGVSDGIVQWRAQS